MAIVGTAPNQTYQRTDGVRTGAAVCAQAKAASVNNTAALADVREQDIATALSTCIFKTGGNTPTANLPMGGFKHTGVGAGSGAGNYVEYAQWLALTASDSAAGLVELATDAEAQTGTDTARAITSANLQAVTATETRKGVVELATDTETQTGTDTARAITPANLQACTATAARKGVIELATDAESIAGSDTDRAVTAAGLAAVLASYTPGRAYATYATHTALTADIPLDDTIPQNTEGTEILSASITPKKASNRIRVRFSGQVTNNGSSNLFAIAALFQDSIASALIATAVHVGDDNGGASYNNSPKNIVLDFEHSPNTVSAVTYKIRVGADSSAMYMNGYWAARYFGGVSVATLILEEIIM
jgi:hypothetical protein